MTEPLHSEELAAAVLGFRRVLRRTVRAAVPDGALPSSEGELLGLVKRSRGISVNDAAAALQLAPNTVSTLVRRLVDAGLLARTPDPNDGRAVQLQLTAAGRARIDRFRRLRNELLDAALATLDADDRAALAGAVGPLNRLIEQLEVRA